MAVFSRSWSSERYGGPIQARHIPERETGFTPPFNPCPQATIGLAFRVERLTLLFSRSPICFGYCLLVHICSNPLLPQPIYATLSDIVVYSRRGATRAAFALAEKFKQAVEARAGSRIPYNVFVLDATPVELRTKLKHLLVGPHTINFAQREKDEMRELTRATEILTVHAPGQDDKSVDVNPWSPGLGQVFLGNVNDVPFYPGNPSDPLARGMDLLDSAGNSPLDGMGYDVCIECRVRAPRPALSFLLSAQEHLMELERRWQASGGKGPRPPPNAAAIVYLPFPLIPIVDEMTLFLEFLEKLLNPTQHRGFGRPAKILIWSSDGYTESSVLALSLIMAMRSLTLPEAYLELQVSPFVLT
jgi:dual specificity MAP kinase phosphatase